MFFLDEPVLLRRDLFDLREAGEREKESTRGAMGREENKERHQSFSSSHHPPHAYLFLILFLFGSQRWPI